MQEIRGKDDVPPARLSPLGWTAIGRIGRSSQPEVSCSNTGYLHTFRSQVLTEDLVSAEVCEDQHDLNSTLKRFWDLETVGITSQRPGSIGITHNEKQAWKKVSESVKHNGEHYNVAVPWRQDTPSLPNNRHPADKGLQLVEKKLMTDINLANAYQQVIDEYLEKGYVRQLPNEEPKPEAEWSLPPG